MECDIHSRSKNMVVHEERERNRDRKRTHSKINILVVSMICKVKLRICIDETINMRLQK